MALDGDRYDAPTSRLVSWFEALTRFAARAQQRVVAISQYVSGRVLKAAGYVGQALKPYVDHVTPTREGLMAVFAWFTSLPPVRFISASLLRRILVSNLLGFAILFVGILYLSLDSGAVINAKKDALGVQGAIIAEAIAGQAKIEPSGLRLDFDGGTSFSSSRQQSYRDDGFAELELSISPQRVAPILRKLTEPIETRARIYDPNGNLIIDSAQLLRSGDVGDGVTVQPSDPRPKTKNFWTRLQHWLIGREVQVYKEIGTAAGTFYPEVRTALKGQSAAMLLLNDKGEQMVSMAVPIRRMDEILGVLLLSTRPGWVDDILKKERRAIWPLALLALLASIVTSWLLARTVAEPMTRLSEAAELVSRDINEHQELPSYKERTDEVGQMAQAFRSMTEALYERIEGSEKFAADVAHELKNPLTAASSTAQSLEYAKTDEQRAELVGQIQGELQRLSRLITDISSASRLDAELARQSQDPVHIGEILTKVLTILEDTGARRGCVLDLEIVPSAARNAFVIRGNEGRLVQVFTNLVDNALSFSPKGGVINVRAHHIGNHIEVTVSDEGPGIDEDKLKTVFTRFYTYRPSEFSSRSDNSGLGLSISRDIVHAHGGQIWAENRIAAHSKNKNKCTGARFIVRLPSSAPAMGRGGQAGAKRT